MTHGFEFRRQDGKVFLDSEYSGIRLVASFDIGRNFNGTINVPKFSINNGAWFVKPSLTFQDSYYGGVVGYGSNPFNYAVYQFGTKSTLGHAKRPDLSWDEAAKQMTITPTTSPIGGARVDFKLRFFHYV